MKKILTVSIIALAFTQISAQTCNLLCNGDFDNNPFVVSTVGLTTSINCWNTEATDGLMEIWGTGYNGVPSYNGNQHMELNATQPAALYQDFYVAGSSVPLSISFAHRGRAGLDSMEVFAGPAGGPYTSLGRYGDGTTSWGYYTASYSTGSPGNYRVRFKPFYWSGGNDAIGNFIDAVSVNAPGAINISATNTSVCYGSSVTLSASGANTYSWTGGPGTSTYVVSPLSSSVYTVTGSTSSGCGGYGTVSVTVYNPILALSPSPATVCQGSSIILNANVAGGTGYVWNGSAGQSTLVVSPTVSTSYVVSAISNSLSLSCPVTASLMVTVNPVPQINVTATKTLICQGSSPVLVTASGGSNYLWMNGATSSTLLSAPVTTVYSVTGFNTFGCGATASVQVVVTACEGLADYRAESIPQVFPNPNNGSFTIKANLNQEFDLINTVGQVVRHFKTTLENNGSVEFDNVPDGIYYIRQVTNDQNFASTKIVVGH